MLSTPTPRTPACRRAHPAPPRPVSAAAYLAVRPRPGGPARRTRGPSRRPVIPADYPLSALIVHRCGSRQVASDEFSKAVGRRPGTQAAMTVAVPARAGGAREVIGARMMTDLVRAHWLEPRVAEQARGTGRLRTPPFATTADCVQMAGIACFGRDARLRGRPPICAARAIASAAASVRNVISAHERPPRASALHAASAVSPSGAVSTATTLSRWNSCWRSSGKLIVPASHRRPG